MQRDDIHKYALPDAPGVYLFKEGTTVVYVGKATHLKSRVKSYFLKDVLSTRGGKVAAMVLQATGLEWIETGSVLEALILEANLIKKYQPSGNTIDKDNKSFNYVIITKEAFPRVLVVRGRELFSRWDMRAVRYTFGPFPDGSSLKEAVALVRKIFPFRDTCTPYSGAGVARPCFNKQIGLCPGVCDGSCSQKEYARHIRNVALFFSAKKTQLVRAMTTDMKTASRHERFEDARAIQRQLQSLQHIRDVALIKRERAVSTGGELHGQATMRIEAFDVAHISGAHTVGVMVALVDGEIEKSAVRKFIIRTSTNDDIHSLTEVLRRRFAHPEWQFPNLIVIDGGEVHLEKARAVLSSMNIAIPTVAVVKDDRHRARAVLGSETYIETYKNDIIRSNAEAHTQAVRFHRKRRDTLQ